jgi:hypothetical protein
MGHTGPSQLMYSFLSTSTGFLYLREAGCVDQELDIWLSVSQLVPDRKWTWQPGRADEQERNLLYVIEVETFVTSVLRPFTSDTADDTW